MKLAVIGDCILHPIDQKSLPELPANRNMKLGLAGSKWYHAEEEFVVTMLSTFAVKNGSWCPVLCEDLVKMAQKERGYKGIFDHELTIGVAVANMVLSGDLVVVRNMDDGKMYLVPQPALGKTIASCKHGWYK